MKQLSTNGSAFASTLSASYNSNFGAQSGILSQLNSGLSSIFNAGPNQSGFSAAENASLTGSAINNAAAQFRNESTIAQSKGGGNTGVQTGGQQQLQAEIASGVGQDLSSNENKINLANAELGRQNFFSAEAGLGGVAQLENPLGYAGAATSANSAAFGEAQSNEQASNQWAADLGGLAGAALGGWAHGGFKTGGGNN